MAYLGNQPSNNFVSLKRQVITGNGGTSYTLDHSVASVNDVAIFVNNVRQDPASYSISGTALTLGGTISSSDSCYVIFLGQALQTVTPATGTVTGAMMSYPLTNFSSTGIDDNADATAITIDSSERVGIGTSSPTTQLYVQGGGNGTYVKQTTAGGYNLQCDAQDNGGTYYFVNFLKNGTGISNITSNGSTISYNTGSDHRLKQNVSYDFDATTRLKQLKPARFNFIEYPDRTVDGFIAHEVSSIVPEAITGEKDAVDENGNPVYQGIDQSKLVPVLTKALQEAITKIEELETRIQTLENN